jgi:hypothetical protein
VSSIGPTSVMDLDDSLLEDWLKKAAEHTISRVVYLHAGFICKVTLLDDGVLHAADPEARSLKILKKLANQGLLLEVMLSADELHQAHTLNRNWILQPLDATRVGILVKERLTLLDRSSGRGTALTDQGVWSVWADAGGRCMFRGCALDLSRVPLTTLKARIGYLAHIIASNPNGPRGSQEESHRRSNDPENFMLLCDGHHRLIDSFAPQEYPAEALFEMRNTHKATVSSLLNSLAFPRAKAIKILADLGGVPAFHSDSDLESALLGSEHSLLPGIEEHLQHTQRDDRTIEDFWVNYLFEHELEISHYCRSVKMPRKSDFDTIAVFPLHHVPTLVMAGRILGESQATMVFQYHRERRTWRWNFEIEPKSPEFFFVEGLTSDSADEVLLSIELTAQTDARLLPKPLRDIPWIRIRSSSPSGNCIAHPEDLDRFSGVARQAINHIQDVMRSRRVHLIGISPASTLFRFGQMLQPGHHPEYTIYDRPNQHSEFRPALTLSGHDVTAESPNQSKRIAIR